MKSTIDAQAAVHVSDFTLPFSDFASAAARAAFELVRQPKPEIAAAYAAGDIAKVRKLWDEHELLPAATRARSLFPVEVTPANLGGVAADIVTPADGISPANRGRVLINLHGGGFIAGAGATALLEAAPVASVGKIKVATLDYRLSPEHVFPAASEDIAAAYRALLKDYRPENIGLFGCSAGGTLAAQAVAWFQKEGLPRPGAIVMVCSNAARMGRGDSFDPRPDFRPRGAAAGKHPLVFRRLRPQRSAGITLRIAAGDGQVSADVARFRESRLLPAATARAFTSNSSRPASKRGSACGTGCGTALSGRRNCRNCAKPMRSSPIFSRAIWGQHSGARAWPLRHCERSEAIQNDAERSTGLLRRCAPRNDEMRMLRP